jgi:hypothetical protein
MKNTLLTLFLLALSASLFGQFDLKLKINTVTGQFKYSEGDTLKTVEGSKIRLLRTQGDTLYISGDGVFIEIRFPEAIFHRETLVFNMFSAPSSYVIYEYRIEDNEVKLIEIENAGIAYELEKIRLNIESNKNYIKIARAKFEP